MTAAGEKAPLLKTEIKSSLWRWLMLLIFVAASTVNAIVWITYSPVADKIIAYYGTTRLGVNALSMVFMVLYVPFNFPAVWLLDKHGLRAGVILGSMLTAAGALLRLLAANPDGYWVAMAGSGLCALGQPFILNAPPKLAFNWFPTSERTLATTIASLGQSIGSAAGFLIAPAFLVSKVTTDGEMSALYLFLGLLCAGVALAAVLLLREKPVTPPSLAAAEERGEELLGDVVASSRLLFANRDWVLIFVQFAIGTGTFITLATLANEITRPLGFSDSSIGLLGVILVASGVVGSGIAGVVVDMTHAYRKAMLVIYGGSVIAAILFAALPMMTHPPFIIAAGAFAVLGLFMTPLVPVSLELSVEVTFPIGEAISTGYLMMASQFVGVALITLFTALLDGNMLQVVYIGVPVMLAAAGLCIVFFSGKLVRLDAERQRKEAEGRLQDASA